MGLFDAGLLIVSQCEANLKFVFKFRKIGFSKMRLERLLTVFNFDKQCLEAYLERVLHRLVDFVVTIFFYHRADGKLLTLGVTKDRMLF